MSKIAFFIESLNPQSNSRVESSCYLIEALAQAQHDIKIYTSLGEHDQEYSFSSNGIEVLRPFTKWSFWEILKSLPALLEFGPDILHFIHPSEMMRPALFSGLKAVPIFFELLKKTVLVTSFLYGKNKVHFSKSEEDFIEMSQLVLLGNNNLKDSLQETNDSKRIKTSPLVFPQKIDFEDTWICQAFKEYLYIPYKPSHYSNFQSFMAVLIDFSKKYSGVGVVFGHGMGSLKKIEQNYILDKLNDEGLSKRFFFAPTLNQSQRNSLYYYAKLVICTHHQDFFEFNFFSKKVLKVKTPILLSRSQQLNDNFDWVKNENCILCQDTDESLFEQLCLAFANKSQLLDEVVANLNEMNIDHFNDLAINEVSRLYVDIYNQLGNKDL